MGKRLQFIKNCNFQHQIITLFNRENKTKAAQIIKLGQESFSPWLRVMIQSCSSINKAEKNRKYTALVLAPALSRPTTCSHSLDPYDYWTNLRSNMGSRSMGSWSFKHEYWRGILYPQPWIQDASTVLKLVTPRGSCSWSLSVRYSVLPPSQKSCGKTFRPSNCLKTTHRPRGTNCHQQGLGL